MKVSWGRVCICASNIVKCYAIILRQVHADLTPFFFFLNQSSHDHEPCLLFQSQNSPVAAHLLKPQAAAESRHVPWSGHSGSTLRCL